MEEQGEILRRRKSLFPKEITQFLKRFQGRVRKKARQAEKIWQRGKRCEHLKFDPPAHCPATGRCAPVLSHRGRTGTSEPRHALPKKGSVC